MATPIFSRTPETADAMRALGAELFAVLRAGDAVLLDGPLGAGKTELARGIIHAAMAAEGDIEDVPSPSFTLVQPYEFNDVDIVHVDLYRLSGAADVWELGLYDALDTSICLIEWPDRMGNEAPENALRLVVSVAPETETRRVDFHGPAPWRKRLLTMAPDGAHA